MPEDLTSLAVLSVSMPLAACPAPDVMAPPPPELKDAVGPPPPVPLGSTPVDAALAEGWSARMLGVAGMPPLLVRAACRASCTAFTAACNAAMPRINT